MQLAERKTVEEHTQTQRTSTHGHLADAPRQGFLFSQEDGCEAVTSEPSSEGRTPYEPTTFRRLDFWRMGVEWFLPSRAREVARALLAMQLARSVRDLKPFPAV